MAKACGAGAKFIYYLNNFTYKRVLRLFWEQFILCKFAPKLIDCNISTGNE